LSGCGRWSPEAIHKRRDGHAFGGEEEGKKNLILKKGFHTKPEDIPKKPLFAFIELGEASNAWKKSESR
jgi:hypothetical protein